MDFLLMDARIYDQVLGAELAKSAEQRGWSIREVAALTGIRPRRLRRVFLGRAPAGPVELKRLVSVLQLNASTLERAVYQEAAVKQLAAETEAQEIDARIREHL